MTLAPNVAAGLLFLVAPTSSPLEQNASSPSESDTVRQHRYSASLDVGFAQFRDELNQGLVFHGGQLGSRFGYTHDLSHARFQWSVGVLFGLYGSHGMPALSLRLDWLDFAALLPIRREAFTLWVGPGIDSDLRWYINPMLHSGSFFWYGHYDLELRAAAEFKVWGQRFRTNLRVAVISAVSRPEPRPDPYFYDWTFADLIGRTHRDMRIGSLESIRHVQAGLEWMVPRRKRHVGSGHSSRFEDDVRQPSSRRIRSKRKRRKPEFGLGYSFRLEDYAPEPSLRTIQHTVNLSWHQR